MKHLKKLLTILFMVVLVALSLRVVLWAIEPFIPAIVTILVVGAVFVVVGSVLFKRTW